MRLVDDNSGPTQLLADRIAGPSTVVISGLRCWSSGSQDRGPRSVAMTARTKDLETMGMNSCAGPRRLGVPSTEGACGRLRNHRRSAPEGERWSGEGSCGCPPRRDDRVKCVVDDHIVTPPPGARAMVEKGRIGGPHRVVAPGGEDDSEEGAVDIRLELPLGATPEGGDVDVGTVTMPRGTNDDREEGTSTSASSSCPWGRKT